MQYIDAFLCSFIVTILIIPIIKKLSHSLDAIDHPGERKIHAEPIPRLGGLGIYFGFVVSFIFISVVYKSLNIFSTFIPVVLGATVLVIVGMIDDIKGMKPPVKLFFQLLVALATVYMGVRVDFFSNPFGGVIFFPTVVSWFVTTFWIVGVTNTINLIDGVDGLAAGVTLIASLTLFIVAMLLGRIEIALLAICISGATVGFLKFNFSPASIFMGDSGSMLLGYILACISVLGVLKSAATLALAIPLLALGIPIIDTASSIYRRIKHKKHIFKADDQHLHHRLLKLGYSQKQVVLVIYYASILLSISALLLTMLSGFWAYACLILIIGIIYLGIRRIKKLQLI